MRIRIIVALFFLMTLVAPLRAAPPRQPKPVEQVERVLIISIDGLRPDLLLRADAPNLRALYENGSYSFWARTTAVSVTLPSHVSMITGVVPEVHTITWNGDLPAEKRVYPASPTLFELARQAGYTTAIATGKSKFNILDRPGTLNWSYFPPTPSVEDTEVLAHALRIIREHRPEVMLVHLAGTDGAGHAKGWGSPEQLSAVQRADQCVGTLMATLQELGLRDETMVIVSADHGGAGRTHGPEDARSRTIPWIVNGPGIRRGFDLTRLQNLEIETYDTFATACTMLGIPIEREVRGKFVSQILAEQELLQPTSAPTTAPATPTAGS